MSTKDTTLRACRACGTRLETNAGRGRPRLYCVTCSPPQYAPKKSDAQRMRRCTYCHETWVPWSRAYCSTLCKSRAAWEKRSGRTMRKTCERCDADLPKNHSKFCSEECRARSSSVSSHPRVCPLIPDKRLKPFMNQPEWMRVTWPRPARIPYGVKVVRRTCVVCDRRFRGKTGEKRCSTCPPFVRLGKHHGPPVEQIGPAYGPTQPRAFECGWCNLTFWSATRRKYCSTACMDYSIPGRRPLFTDVTFASCIECGETYCRPSFQQDVGFCSARCNRRARKRNRRHLKRSEFGGESFTLREIAERDGWRCHLCGGKVPDRQYAARDKDPTLDHLVPVSAGGEHTRANVALAHNRCNWERSNEGAAQLRLVG